MTVYYVNNDTGSNTYNGLYATFGGGSNGPWKSLPTYGGSGSGWTTINAGDTVNLAGGVIWTSLVDIRQGSQYNTNTSGEGTPITIQGESEANRAIWDFTGGGNRAFDLNGVDNITFKYIEVRDINAASGSAWRIGQNASVTSSYIKVLYCYVHDCTDPATITGTPGACTGENWTYGIEFQNASYCEIGYCTIKNIDKKWISSNENYAGSYHEIHHNVMYNEASGWGDGDPMDHGICICGTGGHCKIYSNILWNYHKYYGKNYIIGIIQGGDYNEIYNNIITGGSVGIAVRRDGTGGPDYTTIVHNTIYLQNNPMSVHSCYYDLYNAGIYLEDGTGAVIKNNIIYYPRLGTGTSYGMIIAAGATNITMQYNLFYRNGTDETFYVDGSNARNITYINDTWDGDGGDANSVRFNQVSNPGFSGGNHTVSNLPTGFDGNWHPNNTGLQLTASIAGDNTVGATYATDIQGNTRVNYDVGAYEYQEGEISPKGLASSEPYRIGAITHKQNPRKIHPKH